MYRNALNVKRFLLLLGDLVAMQSALVLTLFLRYGEITQTTWNLHELPFMIVSVLWIVSLFVTGLYDISKARNTLNYFRTFVEGMAVNLLIAVAFFYLLPFFSIEPRTNLIYFFVISLLLIYLWRLAFNRFIAKHLFKSRLLYVGPADDAVVLRNLIAESTLGFELATILHTTPRAVYEQDGINWMNTIDDLPRLIEQERISAVVLGHGIEGYPVLREALYRSLYTSVALIDRQELEETLTGRIPLANVNKSWFLRHLRESEKMWFESTKRGMDILTAIPFALLSAALLPVVAAVIKLSSPGPVFFTQDRVGKHGKTFRMIKFRTMRQDAEKDGAQFATQGDPRITKIGKFLRASRIDELPQIWNVLMGDMTFVGPRPERPEFVNQLTEQMPYYALRHLTRPGLTGWAQVRFRYASSLEENLVKLQYDLFYVKHRSLVLDAAILLKTINTVIRQQGT
ncbi:exopolysaccharide biosynthesis polyprenyl glycosylphosphotransferase [Candidatus Uhrbacteria bacterium]|nr:exopolysaccharide biosynthesis polyprenyl glycosylphosphotransferase [Candidatus Uhrbacteria bacterium]MBD3284008.1 exopolysaccharide biosynthesis polyprenyl glycosylphosphotransferase [Candidatus Uhrbacteria bacterium]